MQLNTSFHFLFPEPILLNFFENLPVVQILIARRVCKTWKRIGENELLWEIVASKLGLKHQYDILSKYNNITRTLIGYNHQEFVTTCCKFVQLAWHFGKTFNETVLQGFGLTTNMIANDVHHAFVIHEQVGSGYLSYEHLTFSCSHIKSIVQYMI